MLKKIVVVFLFFALGLANTLHESYPDEFDNMLGGRYLLEGKVIYKDFFTHHAPVAYYVATLPQLFSGTSFYGFRIYYALLSGLYLLGTYQFLRKRFPWEFSRVYLIFLLVLQVSMTFFWGHMLLADNLAALFFIPVFAYSMGVVLYERTFGLRDLAVLSVLLFLGLLSSLTYSFFVVIFYLFITARYFSQRRNRSWSWIGKFVAVLAAPYLILGLIFLIQGNIRDFYDQAYLFNKNYYLYNYPRPEGSTLFNPVRYAITIAHNFFDNMYGLLTQIGKPNLQYPLQLALAVGNVCFLVYVAMRRQYLLAIVTLGLLVYANVRSNPLTSQDRDYQMAVYFVLSLYIGLVFLWRALASIRDARFDVAYGFILRGMFAVCGVLFFFSSLFLSKQFMDKAYGKYMGTAPLIYDRPELAPIINAAVDTDEYAWIGPFAFENLWYMRSRVPTRYQIMIPAMQDAGYVEKLTAEVREKQPKVIYFDKIFFVLGRSPERYGQPFIRFLDEEYVTYVNFRDGERSFITTKPISLQTDIEAKLYIRKDVVGEVTERLLQAGLIKEAPRP